MTFPHAGPGEHQLTLSDPPHPRLVEEALSGGNTHEVIVRIDGTVRRPTGLWTPGVHALLGHLGEQGFDGARRVCGIDEQGREVLDYVEGEVVHPDNDRLLENAACHIAYGASILGAFEDLPEGLSDNELRGMGVNRAHVHTDLMIGSDEVEVDGLHVGGDAVPLLRGGNWQLRVPHR